MRSKLLVLSLAVLAVASACSGGDSPDTTVTRLGSHLFVPVGESRSLTGLGERLETIHVTNPPAVSVEDDVVVAENGGITCFRYRYSVHAAENGHLGRLRSP